MRLFGILTLFLIIILAAPTALLALTAGGPAPSISGPTLDGSAFDLNRYAGDAVLLKVGTTWCPGCIAQSQEIDKIRDFLKLQNVRYVEVFIEETPARIENFFGRYNLTRPDVAVLDSGSIARALNVYLIPRLILIDRDHNVYRDGEPLSATQLKQNIERMLDL